MSEMRCEARNRDGFQCMRQPHGCENHSTPLSDAPFGKPRGETDPAVWDLVKSDMDGRDRKGVQTYGARLQPFNGRDALRDAYEEALDLAVYLRQALYERDGR